MSPDQNRLTGSVRTLKGLGGFYVVSEPLIDEFDLILLSKRVGGPTWLLLNPFWGAAATALKLLVLYTVMVLWGGKTPEHSAAQEDSWRKIVTFLRRNLYGGSDPHAVNLSHL